MNRNRTYISPLKLGRFFIPWSTAISDISMPLKTLGSSASFSRGCPGARNTRLVFYVASPLLKATPSSFPGLEQREQADPEVRPPGRRWEIRVPSRGPAGRRGGTGGDAHRQRYLLLSYCYSILPSHCFVAVALAARVAEFSPRMFAFRANPTHSWIREGPALQAMRVNWILHSFAWRCMG